MFKQIVSFLALLAYANASCRDITLDACGVGINPPFEQTKGLSIALCEKFCNQIYFGTCKSFTYNKKDSTCELYDVEPLEYADSCAVLGGSVDVDPQVCRTQTDDNCALYTDGYCTYEGEYLDEVLTDVDDASVCWAACN